jgi:hypothetical protein
VPHWFDGLSERAISGEDPVSRRAVLRAGGGGLLAAGILGAPAVAEAGDGLADLLRESSCKCQDNADRRFRREMDGYSKRFVDSGGLVAGLYNPPIALMNWFALTGLASGYLARKVSCGSCERNPSGGNKPAPGKHQPPPAGVGATPGGCPENTVGCAQSSTCCYAGDICCPCRGDYICCVSAVGCACC